MRRQEKGMFQNRCRKHWLGRGRELAWPGHPPCYLSLHAGSSLPPDNWAHPCLLITGLLLSCLSLWVIIQAAWSGLRSSLEADRSSKPQSLLGVPKPGTL